MGGVCIICPVDGVDGALKNKDGKGNAVTARAEPSRDLGRNPG